MTDLEHAPPGQMESTTWAAVGIGNIVRDKNDRLHTVMPSPLGDHRITLQAARDGKLVSMDRPPDDHPVDIYVPSESECRTLLHDELGARLLRDVEEREHTIARALNWRLEPVKRSIVAIRDHIVMVHSSAYVEDLVGRWRTAKENGDKVRAKEQLDTIADAHATMHADPHSYPMAYPHYHAAITS